MRLTDKPNFENERFRKRVGPSSARAKNAGEVARMKKIYKNWHYWSIPMSIVWFGWLEYEVYINLANEDMTALLMISSSGIFGGIIGGIVGLRVNKRTLRTAVDLLCQIEEFQRQE